MSNFAAARSADRLLTAARRTILLRGASSAPARMIASAAGASASAINYNFGGLEQLYVKVFEAEIAALEDFLTRLRDELTGLPHGAAGAHAALLHVVRTWTGDRERALLYAEARHRSPTEQLLGARFAAPWRRLWDSVADDLSLRPGAGALLHLMFESEALFHLSRWRPALEDAALNDLCSCLAHHWLGETAPPSQTYDNLDFAVASSACLPVPIKGEAARIAEAALFTIGQARLEGLTHRAVAQRAGVTVGAVAHYFRTSEALLAGALKAQVAALVTELALPPPDARSPRRLSAGLVALAEIDSAPPLLEARRGLFLAAVREPAHAAACATIRFAQGATVAIMIAETMEPSAVRGAIAGIISRLSTSLWHACAADAPAARSTVAASIASVLVR